MKKSIFTSGRGFVISTPNQDDWWPRSDTWVGVALWLSVIMCVSGIAIAEQKSKVAHRVTEASGSIIENSVAVQGEIPEFLCPEIHHGTAQNLELLRLYRSMEPRDGSSAADARGATPWPAEHAATIVAIRAPGFAPAVFRESGDPVLAAQLDRGLDLNLEIVGTKNPIADAKVTIVPISKCEAVVNEFASVLVLEGSTDEEGTLKIEHVPGGTYGIRVTAAGHESTNIVPVVIDSGRTDFKIRLRPGQSFAGSLSFDSEARPRALYARAEWKGAAGGAQWADAVLAGHATHFTLSGTPKQRAFAVRVYARGEYDSGWVQVDNAPGMDNKRREVVMRAARGWRGSVPAGSGIDRVTVLAESGEQPLSDEARHGVIVTVGDAGEFVVPNVSALSDKLLVFAPGHGLAEVDLTNRASTNVGTVSFVNHHSVVGRLAWEDGAAIDNVAVWTVAGNSRRYCSHTNRFGEFVCSSPGDLLPDSAIRVECGLSICRVSLANDGEIPTYVVQPASVVRGAAVLEGSERPVRRLRFLIGQRGGPVRDSFYDSAEDGQFAIRSEGRDRLSLAVGYAEAERTQTKLVATNVASGQVAVSLPRSAVLDGLVTQSGSGEPISAARIEVGIDEGIARLQTLTRIVYSTPSGEWGFEFLRPGPYAISASAAGFATYDMRASLGDDPSSVMIQLVSPGRVEGVVTQADGVSSDGLLDDPLSVQILSLTGREYNETVNVDEAGRYVVVNVPPDEYGLFLRQSRASLTTTVRTREVTVEAGETAFADFDLVDGIHIFGRAYIGDTALGLADLLFESLVQDTHDVNRVMTGEDGRFSVLVSKAGMYAVKAASAEHGLVGQSRSTIEVTEETSQEIDIQFSSGEVSGIVVDFVGDPIARADVQILRVDEQMDTRAAGSSAATLLSRLSTDAEGRFSLSALSPGSYIVSGNKRGFSEGRAGPIALAEDEVQTIPDIVLQRSNELQVTVRSAGVPIPGAIVGAFFEGDFGRAGAPPVAIMNANGVGTISGLAVGPYSLVALHPGLAPTIVDVTISEKNSEPIALELLSGGVLDIQVRRNDGSPAVGVTPVLIDSTGREVTRLYENLAIISNAPTRTDAGGRLIYGAVGLGAHYVAASSQSPEREPVYISGGRSTAVVVYVK